MSEAVVLALALLGGVALGAFFFGGLWWTVQKGLASDRPALWFSVSVLLRTSVTIVGFYFVAADDWRRLLASVMGFWLARVISNRMTRLPPATVVDAKATRHAP